MGMAFPENNDAFTGDVDLMVIFTMRYYLKR